MKGLLTLKGLSPDIIQSIINTAISFKNDSSKVTSFPDKKMVTLFFENSTRTQYSFQVAMLNLGITPIGFSSIGSSIAKGESLYDTVKTFEYLGVDGVIIRHSQNEFYKELESVNIPIFNAGDGTADHPTQTLLDLMTIYEHFHKFDGLKISLVGDIAHSRVAHGNAEVMKRLGMDVSIVGPEIFIDDTAPCMTLDEAVDTCDIVNLLRVQFERHADIIEMTKEDYHALYGMTKARADRMKKDAIIMHPAPVNRGVEIADSVVEHEKSRIFEQMRNGVYIRMAVISMVLEGKL